MFKPNIYVENVHKINYEKLAKSNIKLVCFDLDNTLDEPDIITKEKDLELKKLFDEIEKLGIKIYIISNNSIKGRVDSFCKIYNLGYIENAKKPFLKKYINDEMIGSFKREEIAFVGDKIVTDVIGGNRFGSLTILVDPIVEKNTHWYTWIMNTAEKVFSYFISFKRGKYYE